MAAGLAAAADNLEKHQLIEREEMALRQRREALEPGARLASANAKRDVYEVEGYETTSHASRHSARTTRRGERKHEPLLMDLVHRDQQQQKIMNAMCLPKVELLHFDGDALNYWLFSRQFDNNVDCNDIDEFHKSLILFQSCSGKARKVNECCAGMDTAVGYIRIRAILKERFGNDFVIAEAKWLGVQLSAGRTWKPFRSWQMS